MASVLKSTSAPAVPGSTVRSSAFATTPIPAAGSRMKHPQAECSTRRSLPSPSFPCLTRPCQHFEPLAHQLRLRAMEAGRCFLSCQRRCFDNRLWGRELINQVRWPWLGTRGGSLLGYRRRRDLRFKAAAELRHLVLRAQPAHVMRFSSRTRSSCRATSRSKISSFSIGQGQP